MDTKLVELRKRAIQKGMELLSEDEILREVKRRRAGEEYDLMACGNLLEYPEVRCALGLSSAVCPDWGTRVCLECDLGQDICDCDFKCHTCSLYWSCPCTLQAWMERRKGQPKRGSR